MPTTKIKCPSMETLVKRYIRALGQCRTHDARNLMYLMKALYPSGETIQGRDQPQSMDNLKVPMP